jgi:hypothetical protein
MYINHVHLYFSVSKLLKQIEIFDIEALNYKINTYWSNKK